MDNWRIFLYPFGFLSAIAFGLRFLVQWFQSEKAGKSVVPAAFWHLSLAGNLLLLMHSFIQIQYHIGIVQACNAVISWRNLNLMQTRRKPASFSGVILLLFITALFTTSAFMLQSYFSGESEHWFRIPNAPWQEGTDRSVSLLWHLLGALGYTLFSARFWVQWWLAEKKGTSILPPSFWILSLIGAVFSILYFLHIRDSVNLIGPLIGIIPYVRNLMLGTSKPLKEC